jgi:hypothetical protein
MRRLWSWNRPGADWMNAIAALFCVSFSRRKLEIYLVTGCGKTVGNSNGAVANANIKTSTIQDQGLPKFKV